MPTQDGVVTQIEYKLKFANTVFFFVCKNKAIYFFYCGDGFEYRLGACECIAALLFTFRFAQAAVMIFLNPTESENWVKPNDPPAAVATSLLNSISILQ